MAERIYETPIPELPEVWRPLHQYEWSMWEEREELIPPHRVGFPKVLSNGQAFHVARNGGTTLVRALFVKPTIVVIESTTLPQAPQVLSSKIIMNVPGNTTARAKDYFQDGFIYVKDHTGKGVNLPVAASDPVVNSTSATQITVTIDGELFIELATDSDVSLVSSPFRNIEQAGAGASFGGMPPDEIQSDNYFWLQKRGQTVGTAGAAVADGAALTPAANGKLITATAGQPIVAYALEAAAADGDVFAIYLCC